MAWPLNLLIQQLPHCDRDIEPIHGAVVVEVHAGSALEIDQQARRVHRAEVVHVRHAVVVVVVIAVASFRLDPSLPAWAACAILRASSSGAAPDDADCSLQPVSQRPVTLQLARPDSPPCMLYRLEATWSTYSAGC